jgi:hypothetical protein
VVNLNVVGHEDVSRAERRSTDRVWCCTKEDEGNDKDRVEEDAVSVHANTYLTYDVDVTAL